MFLLMPRPRPQPSSSTPRVLKNYLLMTFANDAIVDIQGDGDVTPREQQKIIEEGTHQPKDVWIVGEKDDDNPAVQQQISSFFFFGKV